MPSRHLTRVGWRTHLRRRADECAICLETLGPASDVTTTACKHTFHTFCLVETLGNGMCTSCPLCRTEVEKLVPGGLDGQSLKLIAKLRKQSRSHLRAHCPYGAACAAWRVLCSVSPATKVPRNNAVTSRNLSAQASGRVTPRPCKRYLAPPWALPRIAPVGLRGGACCVA